MKKHCVRKFQYFHWFFVTSFFLLSNSILGQDVLLPPSTYEFNMSLTAQLSNIDLFSRDMGDIQGILVYVDDEIRGYADIDTIDGNNYFFLTAYSNVSVGETMNVRVVGENNHTREIATTVDFVNDGVLGSIGDPYLLSGGGSTILSADATTYEEDLVSFDDVVNIDWVSRGIAYLIGLNPSGIEYQLFSIEGSLLGRGQLQKYDQVLLPSVPLCIIQIKFSDSRGDVKFLVKKITY